MAATGDWTCNTIEVEYPAIKQIYRLYGAQERLSVRRCNAPHNYNQESREAVYGFFSKWFHGVDRRSSPESAFRVEADGDLLVFGRTRQKPRNCVSAAQLVSTLQARAERRLRGYRPSDRRAWRRLRRDMGGALRHALGTELPSAQQLDIGTERLRRGGKWLAQQLTIGRCEQGERIPAVFLTSLPFEEEGPAVLVVHPGGRGALMDGDGANPGALVNDLLGRGFRVLAIDLFLTPDLQSPDSQTPTRGEYGAQAIRHFHTYNQSAAACRVQDVLTALAFLSAHGEVSRIFLLGLVGAGIYCLLARSQAGGVQRTAVDLTGFDPSSDSHWVRRCFVPAIRAAGDVRTGVSLIAPAHLLIHGAGRGFPSAWARGAYRSAGKPERLVLAMRRRPRARIVNWLTGQ